MFNHYQDYNQSTKRQQDLLEFVKATKKNR